MITHQMKLSLVDKGLSGFGFRTTFETVIHAKFLHSLMCPDI